MVSLVVSGFVVGTIFKVQWFSVGFPLGAGWRSSKGGQDFGWLGMWGAIYVPFSIVSSNLCVMGTADPGGDKALVDLEQSFGRHLMLMDSSGKRRIGIEIFFHKAIETSLKGSPRSPSCVRSSVCGLGIQ
ncbi:unnamed protein product [Prunus armeniaca]